MTDERIGYRGPDAEAYYAALIALALLAGQWLERDERWLDLVAQCEDES